MSFIRSIAQRRMPWISAVLSCVALTLVFMPTIDAPSIIAARKLPPEVIAAFRFYTDFGKSGWFLWPLGVALIFIAISPHEGLLRWGRGMAAAVAVRFGFLFLAIGLPSLFGTIIKRIIGRARPFVGGAADPYLYSVMAFDVRYASFPSGHATTAFAAAIAISALWPSTRAVMWTYAILMAISRVVVTAHHPSDVVAGALVGIVGAMLVRQWFALRGLGFAMDAGGAITVRPVPSLRRIAGVFRQLLVQWWRATPQRRLPAE
jgi:undecaprenyl-diphosphatase